MPRIAKILSLIKLFNLNGIIDIKFLFDFDKNDT